MSIKSIKEKQLLVNLAKSFGQEVDPNIAKEVEEHKKFENNIRESIRSNVFEDLTKALAELKQEADRVSIEYNYPLPPSLEDLDTIIAEEENDLDQTTTEEITAPVTPANTLSDLAAKAITASAKRDSFQQPDPLLVAPDVNSIQKKIRYLEQWIAKISEHGPGGGEINQAFMYSPTKTINDENYYLTTKDYYIGVNRESKVNIYLPANMPLGRTFIIKDELGQASKGTNRHIYVWPSFNEKIDGQDYVILAFDYGSLTFIKRTSFWSVV